MSSLTTVTPSGSAAPAAEPPSVAPTSARPALEFKGLSHPALRVIVNDASTPTLTQALAAIGDAGANGFEWQPVIIDASRLAAELTPDWSLLVEGLRALRLHPVGLAGAPETMRETAAALRLGWLAALPEPKRRAAVVAAATATAPERVEAAAAAVTAAPPPAAAAPPAAPATESARANDPLVIDRPVRSGQQLYARDRDLVIIGGVSPGAEVIADGNVHIYGPLGGRAIAGARGRRDAGIFTLALQAELVAVCGIYRTFEEGLPPALAGKPVRISLDVNADSLSLRGL